MALKGYLGEQLLGVLTSYQRAGIVHHVGMVYPRSNDELRVFIPRGHALEAGTLVTLHLDNRTGVDELDADLHVYRTSYKGLVVNTDENWIVLRPIEYMLVHGNRVVARFHAHGHDFQADARPEVQLPATPLRELGPIREQEHDNKVGILTTLAVGQPHTTVLAFINTEVDDVFLVAVPGTFKLHLLQRDPHCFFVIDERAKFLFEHAIEWNYTILEMRAYRVPKDSPVYEQVRTAFLLKNPWEAGFFLMDGMEMLHLKCRGVVFDGQPRPYLPEGMV